MNVDTGIWDKLTRVVVTLLVVAALVWVAILYFPLMHQNEAMRQQIIELDQRIQQEEMVNRESWAPDVLNEGDLPARSSSHTPEIDAIDEDNVYEDGQAEGETPGATATIRWNSEGI